MNATVSTIVIDPEIRAMIPLLREAEQLLLEESLKAEGCRDPLVVWQDHGILLDGHHRKKICERHGILFNLAELRFPDRESACDWVDANQLGRRNLTPDQAALLRGRRYNRLKKQQGGTGNNQHSKQSGQNVHSAPCKKTRLRIHGSQQVVSGQTTHLPKTSRILAEKHGVTERTIRRDGKFAEAVDRVSTIVPDLHRRVAAGVAPPRKVVIEAASLLESHPEKAKSILDGTASRADVLREIKREKTIARLNQTQAIEAKTVDGVYDVIVIDPPWPMKKIDRDARPNQTEFDYPTMPEAELTALDLPCAENCHVWLWATHKFLPMAFRLLQAWDLKYVCAFVWHKPGGFQPFGLPQYNCEFALYARRGAPIFIETKSFPTCFAAPRGAHSEKPEEFYATLRRVTAGRRLDNKCTTAS